MSNELKAGDLVVLLECVPGDAPGHYSGMIGEVIEVCAKQKLMCFNTTDPRTHVNFPTMMKYGPSCCPTNRLRKIDDGLPNTKIEWKDCLYQPPAVLPARTKEKDTNPFLEPVEMSFIKKVKTLLSLMLY